MVNPTLAELRTAVRASHHTLSTSNGIPNGKIDTEINNAIEHICNLIFQYNEFYLFTNTAVSIVQDVGTIDLPSDFQTLRKITFGSEDKYVNVVDDFDQLVMYNFPSEDADDGTSYRVWLVNESEMWYRPISDTAIANAFNLYYAQGHGEISADGDEMVLSTRWKRLVVMGARAFIFTSEDLPGENVWAEFQTILEARLNVIRQPITRER